MVRNELEKAQADLQAETRRFKQHRQEVIDVLLKLSTQAHDIVKAFRELGVPSLPILTDDHA